MLPITGDVQSQAGKVALITGITGQVRIKMKSVTRKQIFFFCLHYSPDKKFVYYAWDYVLNTCYFRMDLTSPSSF